jgi:hypothetical protein
MSTPQPPDGLFHDREAAERAWRAATHRQHALDALNGSGSALDPANAPAAVAVAAESPYLMPPQPETELRTKAAEGTGIGGAIGATVGAIAAAVLTVSTSIALPGLGLVVAGPVASALAGAGAGAIAGGLIGLLVGLGIPEERVKHRPGLPGSGTLSAEAAADARMRASGWRDDGPDVYH